MRVPHALRDAEDRDAAVRTVEYDDTSLIVVDLGMPTVEVSVDVLDGMAIVVAGDDQFEFELPPEATDVSVKNGVLTIRE